MFNKVATILQEIGLGDKEVTLLTTLFQYQNIKASDLARHARLNRSTTYAVLKNLVKRGLVTTVEEYGVAAYNPIDPSLLPSYIDRQRDLLGAKKAEIEKILPELERVRENADVLPRVTFFAGAEGVKQAYEDTLDNNKGKVIYVFSGPDSVFKEFGEEYVNYYVQKRTRLGIKSFQVAPATEWGKFIKENDSKYIRVTKLIPAEYAFDTEMVIYDNKLGIFSFSKNKLMAVIIEDAAIANTVLALFRYIDSNKKV